MNAIFKYDFVNKTIIASKTALRKAGTPGTDEFKALMAMVVEHPDFKVVEREPKKVSNKATYKGLTLNVIEFFVSDDEKRKHELSVCVEMGGYPMAKRWFLNTYPGITMEVIQNKLIQLGVEKNFGTQESPLLSVAANQ